MTEVVAMVGGGRVPGGLERRFLVPSDEYAARGPFGFVINEARHAAYDGPSSFMFRRRQANGA